MTTVELPSDGLIILVAPAGAGKSTFARRRFGPTEIVSSDACRALVSDDEANQTATDAAYTVFYSILRGRLSLGRLSVADATNLDAATRLRLRTLAAEFGRPSVALVLDVPIERCQAQNRARARRVPDDVILLHYEQYRTARELLPTEGHSAVHTIPADADIVFARTPS